MWKFGISPDKFIADCVDLTDDEIGKYFRFLCYAWKHEAHLPNDIDRGYFTRYFCKRANEKINYFEISEETYSLLLNEDPKYDFNLYTIGSLEWALKEINSISQEEINKNTLDSKQIDFPLIKTAPLSALTV